MLTNPPAVEYGEARIVPVTKVDLTPAPVGDLAHVVIVGAGFGGLACARALGNTRIRVTLVDRNNYHLFVPLLYQVATAALSPADIAEPVRRIVSRFPNIDVVMGNVTGVDAQERKVLIGDEHFIPYHRLVLATGSVYSYFGNDHWAQFAPGLKSIDDARLIRSRLLGCFEQAETCRDKDERAALMTTIIIGGGPTGVEMAGAIAELARFALARDFRRIDPRAASILLIEAGPRLLATFPEVLSRHAQERLRKLGVTILTGKAVESVEPDGVVVEGKLLRAGTMIWGAGIRAADATRWLQAEVGQGHRLVVASDLSLPGYPDIYAIGDLAVAKGDDGQPLPALAQVAKQQGRFLGRALARNMLSGAAMGTFRFHNRGNTAVIGRNSAVFDFGRHRLKGWLAWILWGFVHVYLLVGFQNRLTVTMQWLWQYLTYQTGARLITTKVASIAPARQDPGDKPL